MLRHNIKTETNLDSHLYRLKEILSPYQNIRLESGKIIAKGYTKQKLDIITKELPDVSGKDILDIGANSGAFGIIMATRGANHVVLNEATANNRTFAAKLANYARVNVQIDGTNLFPNIIAKYQKRFDYVFALAVVQHIFRNTQNLDTIFRLLQSYAREGVMVEYCGDRDGYVRPGHDYETFTRSMLRTFESVKSLGTTLPNRELFFAKCKKSEKQYITICGTSQIGKKTFIVKLLKDKDLCRKLGIKGPKCVFSSVPWKFGEYGKIFLKPSIEMRDYKTVLHFWQPRSDGFMKLWQNKYPEATHRILVPYRQTDEHFPSFMKLWPNLAKKQYLINIRKQHYKNLLLLGIPIEVLNVKNHKIIRANWDI